MELHYQETAILRPCAGRAPPAGAVTDWGASVPHPNSTPPGHGGHPG